MAWYWQVFLAVVFFDVLFALTALLRSVILDRVERSTSGGREERYFAEGLVRRFLECPWPTLSPSREAGGQLLPPTGG
jgi:hypothetical protein